MARTLSSIARQSVLSVALVLASALAACGEKEEDIACCAIEPKAKCESELLGNGVTHAELSLLLGSAERICPSAEISEARIREIAPIWAASDSCRLTRGYDRLGALQAGLCSPRAIADAPPLPPGVDLEVATTCTTGLVARGVNEAELWIVLGAPEGVCPKAGITEQRLRDIIAKDWAPASCTQFTAAQMLNAMNAGACGGDAG